MSVTTSPVLSYSQNKQARNKLDLLKVSTLVPGNWKRTTHVGKLAANPVTLTERPVCFTKRTISALERKWRIILAFPTYAERSLSSAISKTVTKLVRHFDQDERQTDAAVHWDSIGPVLLNAFADMGASEFSE